MGCRRVSISLASEGSSARPKSASAEQPCGFGIGEVSINVNLESLYGFLVGTESTRLQAFCKSVPEMDLDVNEWKYASLVTKTSETYDFAFASRQMTTDFIVAISKATSPQNP